jgi:crotonobetainyl-CoA:carnitine CoA-transferase CaiB-like acyl-CoA transferase
MDHNEGSNSLLCGCRCLDLTNEKGLYCGKLLAELGADVIKVEPPGGDSARNIGPFYKDISHPEKSLYWFALNTNKRSITLDIETADGKDIFKRLLRTADVVIESFDPGYMNGLGLDYPALEKTNPRVIMTSIAPFGQTGPYAGYKGSDITLSAMGGFMFLNGDTDRPPVRISAPQSYLAGGAHAASATVIAYYHQQVTGEGQHVDVSIQEAVIHLLSIGPTEWESTRINARRAGPCLFHARPTPPGPTMPRFHWPCKDGYVSFMIGGGTQKGMVTSTKSILEMMEKEGLAGWLKGYDPRTFDGSSITQEERERMNEVFLNYFRTKTKKELFEAALEKGIVLCPMNTIKDVVESPQLATRDFFIEVEHPDLGESITYPGFSVKVDGASPKTMRRAPLIGEHNEDIYEKEMGISRERLIILKQAGVI